MRRTRLALPTLILLAATACTADPSNNMADANVEGAAELVDPPIDLAEHPDLANQAAAAEAADAAIGGELNADEVSAAGNYH